MTVRRKKRKGSEKLKLELFYIYIVMMFLLLLSTLFFLKPAITGFVVYTPVANDTLHTLEINMTIEKTTELPITLVQNITSLTVDAEIVGKGDVRIYLENNVTRYLIAEDLFEEPVNLSDGYGSPLTSNITDGYGNKLTANVIGTAPPNITFLPLAILLALVTLLFIFTSNKISRQTISVFIIIGVIATTIVTGILISFDSKNIYSPNQAITGKVVFDFNDTLSNETEIFSNFRGINNTISIEKFLNLTNCSYQNGTSQIPYLTTECINYTIEDNVTLCVNITQEINSTNCSMVNTTCLNWSIKDICSNYTNSSECINYTNVTTCINETINQTCINWTFNNIKNETECSDWTQNITCNEWFTNTSCIDWMINSTCNNWTTINDTCLHWNQTLVCKNITFNNTIENCSEILTNISLENCTNVTAYMNKTGYIINDNCSINISTLFNRTIYAPQNPEVYYMTTSIFENDTLIQSATKQIIVTTESVENKSKGGSITVIGNLTLNITTNITENITEEINDTNITQEINVTINETNETIEIIEEPIIRHITGECIDTCALPDLEGDFKLVVEIEGEANVTITNINYITKGFKIENTPPILIKPIDNITLNHSQNLSINLAEHFMDADNLTYQYDRIYNENVDVVINQSIVIIQASNKTGTTALIFYASDGINTTASNIVYVNVTPSIFNLTETLEQGIAEIGKPVKWIKTLNLNLINETTLPYFAQEIKVKKISADKIKIEKEEGFSSLDVKDKLKKVKDLIKNKGKKIKVKFNKTNETEAVIEYTTPGPEIEEINLTKYIKQITIYGVLHYTNVTTYINITEVPEWAIRLYWISNSSRQPFTDIIYHDTNNNSLVDKLEWVVPHLSNQTFEVEIIILNIQSYPTVGGNWTVRFLTLGTANLTISASNGTLYNSTTLINLTPDLEWLKLECNNTLINATFNDTHIFYADWNCSGEGNHTVKVLTPGAHYQRFVFGNQTAYAKNFAKGADNIYNCSSCSDCTSAIADASAGDIVRLNESISATSTCINFGGYDNIIFDCNGFTISGDGDSHGIYVSNSHNSTAMNCNITNFDYGIEIYQSDNATIINLNLSNHASLDIYFYQSDGGKAINITSRGPNNDGGITIRESPYTTIDGYDLRDLDSSYGIWAWSASHNASLNNIHIYKTENHGFAIQVKDATITNSLVINSTDGSGISCDDCDYIHIENFTGINLSESGGDGEAYGIFLYSAPGPYLKNVYINNTEDSGVFLRHGSNHALLINVTTGYSEDGSGINRYGWSGSPPDTYNTTLINCISHHNTDDGVYLSRGENYVYNTISYSNGDEGFEFQEGSDSIYYNLTSYNNSFDGILIFYGNYNNFTLLNLYDNTQYGLHMYANADYNIINNSRFVNNTDAGIYMNQDSGDYNTDNEYYNCFFNNTNNVLSEYTSHSSFFNTNLDCSRGPNIVNSACIAGNFWAEPDGTGFSQYCNDTDGNGICDESYNVDDSMWDYKPLTWGPPFVTLNQPTFNNNSVSLTETIIFNCSAISGNYILENITLYTNMNGTWKKYQTKSLSGISDSETFDIDPYEFFVNDTFKDSQFPWNCKAFDSNDYSDWGHTNYTFSGWALGNHTKIGINSLYAELPSYSWNDQITNMNKNLLLLHFNSEQEYGENFTHAFDFSGNGNNATCYSGSNDCPTWTPLGKIEGAFYYDEIDDYFDVGSDIVDTNAVTVCAWIKPTTFGDGGFGRLVSNQEFQISIRDLNDDIIVTSNDWSNTATSDSNVIKLNKWQHICVVRPISTTSKIYFNAEDVTVGVTSGTPQSGTQNIEIGRENAFGGWFNGTIDEFAIWNRTLSTSEITAIFNRQKTGHPGHRITLTVNDTKQELPNYKQNDGYVDMKDNVFLVHFNKISADGENYTYAHDYSGRGNDGLCYLGSNDCPDWKPNGKLGGSFYFDGSDDYFSFSAFDFGDEFTIAAWVFPWELSQLELVVGNRGGSNADGFLFHVNHWATSDRSVEFETANGATSDDASSETGVIEFHQWNHIAVRVNKTAGTAYIYVNGVDESDDSSTRTDFATDNAWRIGIQTDSFYPFKGNIDEVAIWNRTLSPAEILNIYNRQRHNYINIGDYESKVFNATKEVSWLNLTWDMPFNYYNKELSSNQAVESKDGGIDMTDNILLFHYNRNATAGETNSLFFDFSGSKNNGSCIGTTCPNYRMPGKFGAAFDFNRSQLDNITAGDIAEIGGANSVELSVSAWVKPSDDDGGTIVSKWNDLTTGKVFLLNIYYLSTAHAIASVHEDDVAGTSYSETVSDYPIPENEWTHLAFTFVAGSGTGMKLFVNGIVQSHIDSTTSVSYIEDNSYPVTIGTHYGANGEDRPYDGLIDEVAIWNRTLSEKEIFDIYRRGALRLGLQVRSCNDVLCSGENWTGPYGTDTLPKNEFDERANISNGANMTDNVLLLHFDDADTVIRYTVDMDAGTSWQYEDLTSVSNYIIQEGDYVEYDIYLTASGDKFGFDYRTSDAYTLRASGMKDQNDKSAHPGTDITAYALNQWYHRIIPLNSTHVGKTVTYWDVACENDENQDRTAYFDNIKITDGAGEIRKNIYRGDTITHAEHHTQNGATLFLASEVIEKSGYGNNGTVNGSEWTSFGKIGGAFEFDGINDFIEIEDDGSLGGMSSITISAWVNYGGLTGTHNCLLQKESTYNFRAHSTDLEWYINDGSDWQRVAYSPITNLPTGEWTFIAATWNVGSIGDIYINGINMSAGGNSQDGAATDNSNPLRIGRRITTEAFNGMIDEVAIWNRSLSSDEIYDLYMKGHNNYFEDTPANLSKTGIPINQFFQYKINFESLHGTFSSELLSDSVMFGYKEVDLIYPIIDFSYPTPENDTITKNNSIQINVTITEANLNEVIYNWNGTNYTLYNDTVTSSWNFDGNSNDMRGVFDLTLSGDANYDTGKYGQALNVSGNANSYSYNTNDDLAPKNSSFSMSVWLYHRNFSSVDNANYVRWFTMSNWCASPYDPGNEGCIWWIGVTSSTSPGQLSFSGRGYNDSAGTSITTGVGAVSLNTWNHVVFIVNRETARGYAYVDGLMLVNASISNLQGTLNMTNNFQVPANYAEPDMMIDDFYYYNRSLSGEEIQFLYMSNLRKYDADNWSLYVNQTKNATDVLDDGYYTFQAFAKDNSGNKNQTEERTILIDQTYPTIDFSFPTPEDDIITRNTSIPINFSITEAYLDSIIYNWNGTNYTIYNDTLVLMYNFDNVSSLGEDSDMINDASIYYNHGTLGGSNNTINNSGFESEDPTGGDPADAEYWIEGTNGDRESDKAYSGLWSMKIVAPTSAQNNRQTGLRVTADTDYELSGWVYNSMDSSTNAYLDLNDIAEECHAFSTQGNDAWEFVSCGFTTGGSTTSLTIRIVTDGGSIGSNTGDVWFDDVRITAVKPTSSSGKYGGGYVFDGIDDYIEIENDPSLQFDASDSFTLSCWIKTDGTGVKNCIRTQNNTAGYRGLYGLRTNDGGNVNFLIRDQSANLVSFSGSKTVTDDEWHQIVGVRDVSSDKLFIYVDGVYDNEAEDTTANSLDSHIVIYIGSYLGQAEYYNGSIDEIQIWKRALSAEELQIMYMSNLRKYDPDKWSFYINQTKNATTDLDDGTYTYRAFVSEKSKDSNQTEERTIHIDQYYPSIEFSYPTPENDTTTENTSIQINFSITEANVDKIIYNWNGTNYTIYNDSLILMYNFDNISAIGESYSSSESTVKDLSKNDNHGTTKNGVVWEQSGRFGGSFDFDSTDDYITVASPSGLPTGSVLSITAWIKPRTQQGDANYNGIVGYGPRTCTGTSILLSLRSNGYVSMATYCNDFVPSSGPTVDWNEWNFVAVTLNGQDVYLYTNGQTTSTILGSMPNIQSGAVNVGSTDLTGGRLFNGSIDEVRIWNKTLSYDEIQFLYMSNLRKYDSDSWSLYVNQTKNTTADLDYGVYTYQAFASETSNSINQTEERTITILKTTDYNTCSPTSGNNLVINTQVSCNDVLIDIKELTLSSSGNFNLTNVTIYSDNIVINQGAKFNIKDSKNTIWVNANLTINGLFNMSNTTLRMNGTSDGVAGINVTPTGWMVINDSSNITNGITSTAEFYFIVQEGSNFSMEDSYLSECGWASNTNQWGLEINTTVDSFKNNIIRHGYAGLVLHSDTNYLENNLIYNNSKWGIGVVYSNNNTFTNLTLYNNSDDCVFFYNSDNNTFQNSTVSSVVDSLSDGIFAIQDSDNNRFIEINISEAPSIGFLIRSSNFNSVINSTIISSSTGIVISRDSDYNNITGSTIENNSIGIFLNLSGADEPENNLIHNNKFNNTNNLFIVDGITNPNYLNITQTTATNIIGGDYIGGNFWATSSGTGFSEYCNDTVPPVGICDEIYNLTNGTSKAVDYLPLRYASLIVSLNKPININNTIDFSSVTFNCSANGSTLINASLYSDYLGSWERIETKTLSGNFDSETFSKNIFTARVDFISSEFNWNCKVCDSQNCKFAEYNFTFSNWDLGAGNKTIIWPMFSELPNNRINGDIDMTGNVLLLHYNYDESYGENSTYVYDYSGSGNNGSCTICPTWTSNGKLSSAFEFDSAELDYFDLGSDSSLNIGNGSLTVNAWIFPTSLDNSQFWNDGVFGKFQFASDYFSFYLRDEDRYWFTARVSSTSYDKEFTGTKAFTKGKWYMVTFILNRATDEFIVYQNGEYAGNDTGDSMVGVDVSNTGSGYVGKAHSSQWYFNGTIDEVAIWNRSLSSAEILNIYNHQKEGYPTHSISLTSNDSLQELPNNQIDDGYINMTDNVMLYHFNNDSNAGENDTLVFDFSASKNNATCSGTACPTWTSSGKLNGVFEFDGLNDKFYITASSSTNDIFNGGGTISAWIYIKDYPSSTYAYIVHHYPSDGTGYWLFWISNQLDRKALLFTRDWPVGDALWSAWNATKINTWIHVAVTLDDTLLANNATLYVDGKPVEISEREMPSGAYRSDNGDPMSIGGRYNTITRQFKRF